MQVSKWGNSLAVRLPKAVVKVLQLKEGDEIEITIKDRRQLVVERGKGCPTRDEIMRRLEELSTPLPPGFKFNRDEANER